MREQEIDVLRGYCIASMIFSHFASGSIFAKLLHISPYFDGASGFVFLSGIVLGRVVRSRVFGLGLRHAVQANLKRVFEVYLYHLLIVFSFVVFSQIGSFYGGGEGFGSGAEIFLNAVFLNLGPSGGSVLRLYVMIMLFLTVIIILVAKGEQALALVCGFSFYFFARHFSDIFSFPAVHGESGFGANWGAWQLLFILAFLVGWNWSRFDVAARVGKYAYCLVGLLVLAVLVSHLLRASDYGPYLAGSFFSKTQMGLGRVIYAFVVMVGLYALTRLLMPYLSLIFQPFALVGMKSLDTYVMQAIILSGLAVVPFAWAGLPNVYVAFLVFFLCYVWARYKTPASPQKSSRGAAGVGRVAS